MRDRVKLRTGFIALLLAVGSVWAQQQGRMEGKVTLEDGVTPVPGHLVDLENYDTGEVVTDGITDANGEFSIRTPRGDYRVRTISDLSVNSYLTDEYFDDTQDYGLAARVTIVPGQITANIDFRLSPAGRFSGVVRRQDDGAVIEDAEIAVYDDSWQRVILGVEQQFPYTGGDGEYDLWLSPGTYYIAATGQAQGRFVYQNEYFNESMTRAGAVPVVIVAGTTVDNIDFTLVDLPPVFEEAWADPEVVLPGEELEIWADIRDGATSTVSVVAQIEFPDENVVATIALPHDEDTEFAGLWTTPAHLEARYLVDIIATDANGNSSTNDNAGYFYAHVPATIHVDDSNLGFEDGSAAHPYNTINEGVSNAIGTDTVLVHDGTYVERVTLNTSQLILRSENGYASTTVMRPVSAPTSGVAVIIVDGNEDITVRGFTVTTGLDNEDNAGIYVGDAWNCTVADNYVYGCGSGISLGEDVAGEYDEGSEMCVVRDNICVSNVWAGIDLDSTWGCLIANNRCDHNGVMGITVDGWDSHTVVGNRCAFNGNAGVAANECSGNVTVRNVCISNAIAGLRVDEVTGQHVYLNTLVGNAANVVSPDASNDNFWRTETPIYYVYNGAAYSGRLGSYYDDRGGNDNDGNGIGSVTYVTDGSDDTRPLWQPAREYGLSTWWLAGEGAMYCDAMDRPHDFVDEVTQPVWTSAEAFAVPANYPAMPWYGQLYLVEPPGAGETVRIEVGSSADGSTFVPGGPDALHTQSGDEKIVSFTTDSAAFAVPAGSHLAVRLTFSTTDYEMFVGGAWNYVSGPIPDPEDIDRDNLLDSWELTWANGLGVLGATTDTDGDGLLDREEADAGTDPTSSASVLALTGASDDGTSGLVIRWDSVNGILYKVYDTPALNSSWSETGFQVQGDGTPKSYTNDNASTTERFFKIGAGPVR
jgi:parallel beta-helix repeat protein